jgi:selenocysteine lyase/cysteine desulfurase
MTLVDRIRNSVIGDDTVIDGPFGPRRLVYADHTASGRALSLVEDHIRSHVLPLYANTHTEASATGLHTSALREDARRIIHGAVNGGDDDVVLFCGSGTTGAIDKLMRLLALRRRERPVVFVGPYEHHSNELPWRESIAHVVPIREHPDGGVDLDHLEAEWPSPARPTAPESTLADYLEAARAIIRGVEDRPPRGPELSADFERIRWFPLPGEALAG